MQPKLNNPQFTEYETNLLLKIKTLPPDRITEVEDFVDFLRQSEDRQLRREAAKMSEDVFQDTWNNPEDAEYDRL